MRPEGCFHRMKKEILLKITKNYVVIKNIEFYDEKNYNNERVARGELVFISTLTKSGYKLLLEVY